MADRVEEPGSKISPDTDYPMELVARPHDAHSLFRWRRIHPSEAPPPQVLGYLLLQGPPPHQAGFHYQSAFDGYCQLAYVEYHRVLDRPPALLLTGAHVRLASVPVEGFRKLLVAKIHACALGALSGGPAHRLKDRILPLERLWGRDGADCLRELAAAPRWQGKAELLNRRLRQRLGEASQRTHHSLLRRMGGFRRASAEGTVRHATRGLDCGQRQLHRLFRHHLGLGLKDYARTLRLLHALNLAARQPNVPLKRLALEAGYSDQSHLCHDFSQLTGRSPGRLIEDLRQGRSRLEMNHFLVHGLPGRQVGYLQDGGARRG